MDARRRERGADRPPDRGRGLLRQRRPAQLRRAGAADGRLEGVRAGLATRAGRDPQVREAAVADDHPGLRPFARPAHVPVLGGGHPAGGRCDQRARHQRAVHGRAASHPAGPLRHADPVAATALARGRSPGCRRRGRSPWLLVAGRVTPRRARGDRGRAAGVGGDRGAARRPRLAARHARRARDGRRDPARGPGAAHPRRRRFGPGGARRHPHAARPGALALLRAAGPRHGAESELGCDRLSRPPAPSPRGAEAARRSPTRGRGRGDDDRGRRLRGRLGGRRRSDRGDPRRGRQAGLRARARGLLQRGRLQPARGVGLSEPLPARRADPDRRGPGLDAGGLVAGRRHGDQLAELPEDLPMGARRVGARARPRGRRRPRVRPLPGPGDGSGLASPTHAPSSTGRTSG